MASTLTTFTDSEIRMRYREPYVTEGLNQKMSINTAPGVYRGFLLEPNGSNNVVTIGADNDKGDHHAVFQTGTGFSVSITRAGDFNVDLTPMVGGSPTTVALVVSADYQVGSTTTATVVGYEVDPVDEFTIDADFENFVVLGTVVIPAGGGLITDIRPAYRRSAWEATAPEAVFWSPLVRNSGFEWGLDTSSQSLENAYWRKEVTSGTGSIVTTAVGPGRNGTACQSLQVSSGPVEMLLSQQINVPVSAGQKLKYVVHKKVTATPAAGAYNLVINFGNQQGQDTTTVTVELESGSVDADFVEVSQTIEVATGDSILLSVGIEGTGLTGTPTMLIDDFQVFLSPTVNNKNETNLAESGFRDVGATSLVLIDPSVSGGIGVAFEAAQLKYDRGTDTVILDGREGSSVPSLEVNGLEVTGPGITGTTMSLSGNADFNVDARSSWPDAETNPATDIDTALDKIITDVGGTAGAARVGAAATGLFSSGTVRSQLDELAGGLRDSIAIQIPLEAGQTTSGTNPWTYDFTFATNSRWFQTGLPSGGAGMLMIPIYVAPGAVITQIVVSYEAASGNDIDMSLLRLGNAGIGFSGQTRNVVGTTTVVGAISGISTGVINVNHTVLAGQRYVVEFLPNSGSGDKRIYNLQMSVENF